MLNAILVLQVIIPVAAFFLVTFAVAAIMELIARKRTRDRMYAVISQQVETVAVSAQLRKPLWERLVKPMLARVSEIAEGMLPGRAAEDIQLRLQRAGAPRWLTPGAYVTLRLIVAAVALVVALRLPGRLHADPLTVGLLMVGLPAAGMLPPEWLLDRAIKARQRAIMKALPDALDLLVVSVEAGTGLEGAVQWLVRRARGPIAEEFRQVLSEIRLGKPRMQAWEDLAQRIDIPQVHAFVAAVRQAEELGVSLGRSLRTQADVLRAQRAQKVREAAAALPVKMLFPLIFCVFPALFVVVLGPGMITILHTMQTLRP